MTDDNLFWQQSKSTLNVLVQQPRLGILTDVDGTISPIVDEPDAARVTPENRRLLAELAAQITLVGVISGRSVRDVRRRVDLPGLVYVGNHGFERWVDGRPEQAAAWREFLPHLKRAREEIERQTVPGMWVEDKGATLSVHYRQTADPVEVERRFGPLLQAIAHNQHLKLFPGRMVFELRPPLALNKGTAFKQLVREFELDGALYLGDDVTDVDALLAARQLRDSREAFAVGVGVASSTMPAAVAAAADFLAAGVAGVEALFAWLLKARIASST